MIRLFAGWLYFLGGVAVIGGAVIYFTNIPNIPDEDDLEKFSGFLIAVRLEKDFDGTDIVHLRFRDHERTYKYMSTYPLYVEVRDRLGIYRDVDVWIEKDADLPEGGAQRVWGLVEHDPYNPGTVVTYDEIYEETTQTDRSWQEVGIWMAAAGLAAIAIGYAIRRAVPYKPRDPSA